MRVEVTRASDMGYSAREEWSSLDDLLGFMEREGRQLIISPSYKEDCVLEVMLYDDYVE